MKFERVGVAGAGTMGYQIAALAAISGCDVTLYDINAAQLQTATEQIAMRLGRMAERDQLDESAADVCARIRTTQSLEDLADVDLLVEAIAEDLEIKASFFRQADAVIRADAVFATNSSSLVASLIAEQSDARPDRFINLHFFNPPLVMECVEIAAGAAVDPEVTAAVQSLAVRMRKRPVVLDKEIPGLIANRLLAAILREASNLFEAGVASIDVIDEVCRTALRHPMGPFELIDMAGLDINLQMANMLYAQTGDAADLPIPAVGELVDGGRFGRKTGSGFYEYDNGQKKGVATW